MPVSYRLSRRAVEDLRQLLRYIARDSERASLRVENAILETCSGLARNPGIGSKRPQITSLPVRFFPVARFPNYQVIYRPESNPLQIIAILHGRRDLPPLLKER